MTTIRILSSKVFYDKWANLTEYRILYSSERVRAEVVRVAFNSGDGAAVFLYNPDEKKVMLIKQFRYGAYFNSPNEAEMIEVCAGIVEENDPKETAKRESLEETGLLIESLQKVGEVYVSPGAHTEKIHLFVAQYAEDAKVNSGGGVDTENEDIEVVELSYSELKSLYFNNKIKDAKTMILVQHWLLHLIEEQ